MGSPSCLPEGDALKVLITRVGRGRNRWADEAAVDYSRRLARSLAVEEVLVKPEPFRGDVGSVQSAEAQRIVALLREGDRLVVLDERGTLVDTPTFAGWIDEAARLSARRLVFAIGGPYGHGPEVKRDAWRTLALSPLVLNHELARIVLVEQLYRASTLLWGGPYHH